MDAYWWSGMDWRPIVGAFFAIGTAAFPSGKAWLTGQMKAAESAQERLDRRENDLFEHVVKDRDSLWERLRETEADCLDGWDFCRGWESHAHDLRHDYNGLAMRFNVLLEKGMDSATGKLSPDQWRSFLLEVQRATESPRLPPVRGMKKLQAHEAVSSADEPLKIGSE